MAFDVGSIVAHLNLDQKGWKQAIKDIKKDQKDLGGFVLNNEQNFKKFGMAMTVAGTAITASFGAMIIKAAKFGDEMSDLSQKTGISVSVLSSFKIAADKSDLSMDRFAIGMKGLAQSMVEAKNQGSGAAKIFDFLKVKTTNADGSLRSMDSVLLDVAGAFSAMPDGAQKATIAVDLFGRSGLDMIEFLNMGKDGLQANIDKAKEYGLVIGTETAAAGDKFKETLDEMKGALTGVGLTIGNMLLPMAQSLIEGVTKVISKLRELIELNPTISTSLSAIAVAGGAVMIPMGALVMMLPNMVKGFTMLKVGLGLTTAGLWLTVGAFTAITAAAAATYKIVSDLTNAKNSLTDADYAAFEAEQKLGKKLREAADAAGMTRAAYFQLTEKYNGNTAALAMAIKRGAEGVTIQKALAAVGKENAQAQDKITASLKNQQPELDLNALKVATLAEKLNLLTRADILKKIQDNRDALKQYGENLPISEQDRLNKEIKEFEEQLNPIPGLLNQVNQSAQAAADDGMLSFSNLMKMLATTPMPGFSWHDPNYDWNADLMESFRLIQEKSKQTVAAVKKTVDATSRFFDGLYNDIAMGLGDALEGMFDGTKSFADAFVSIWKSIKKAFFRIIGEMVAGFLVNFVKKIIAGMSLIKAFESALGIGGTIAGAAAGAVGTAAGTAGGAAIAGGAFGETMAGSAAAAGAGAGVAISAAWVTGIGFAAILLGGVFGLLFGRTAADKWETEFNARMKAKYGQSWHIDPTIISLEQLKQINPPTPSIDFPGRKKPGGGTVTHPGSSGDMQVTFHISALDGADVAKVVRNKVIPMMREAARRHEFWMPLGSAGGV